MEQYYWKVTPRMHTAFIAAGLIGVGLLLSMFSATDKVWAGYIGAGVVLGISYQWEYHNENTRTNRKKD